ncbi:MAG: 4Fe-4S dicluster domain-containing protein [Anaerolineaceae bacterium]|nr:4Fe-4S dicluster domain-containing protein [Anaerolineaceae bacterium]
MLDPALTFCFYLASVIWLLIIGGFGVLSIKENEPRATRISFFAACLGALIFIMLAITPLTVNTVGFAALLTAGAILLILFLMPLKTVSRTRETPHQRFDERDIVLSRWRLGPGTPEHEAYYKMRPENKAADDLTRAKPGLSSPDSLFANPLLCTAADASFSLVGSLVNAVDGPAAETRFDLPIEKMTAYIKGLARYYGALDVGITELKPYQLYSHAGRSPAPYGSVIESQHKYAIPVSVEMDYDMVAPNPTSPGSMETAKQYVEVARVAIQLANAIRLMGYPARAHIEANYQVICTLVAQDAGLGEIGRMGLVITPHHGPRVRLAAVTTSLDLLTDTRRDGSAVIDFCTVCKKCALNCPSQSIPFGDRQEIEDALRWRINADTCIRYWMTAGTDCGRCLTVCPYSHPNNFYHNIVRQGIERSAFFRRAANAMDDMLYGKKPARRNAPKWLDLS